MGKGSRLALAPAWEAECLDWPPKALETRCGSAGDSFLAWVEVALQLQLKSQLATAEFLPISSLLCAHWLKGTAWNLLCPQERAAVGCRV